MKNEGILNTYNNDQAIIYDTTLHQVKRNLERIEEAGIDVRRFRDSIKK